MKSKNLIELNLELHQILREDLNCYLIYPHEIKRVFEMQNFFNGLQKKDDIENHIQKVTGMLFDRSLPTEILFRNYISAAAACVFVQPLIVKSLDDKIVKNFVDVIRKSPYFLEDPLLLFHDADSGYLLETESIRSEFNSSIIDIDKDEIMFAQKFDRSDNFKRKMREKLIEVSNSLYHNYSEIGYFSFIGLYHVCLPIFGVRNSRRDYSTLYEKLKETHGTFHLTVPNSLVQISQKTFLFKELT